MTTPIEIKIARFHKWLGRAHAGDRFIYHVGNLAVDRGPEEARVAAVDAIASEVWRFSQAGLVMLVQERVDPRSRAYMAVRTRRSLK